MTWEELVQKYGDGDFHKFFTVYLDEEMDRSVTCWRDGEVHISYDGGYASAKIRFKNRTYDQMDMIINGLNQKEMTI